MCGELWAPLIAIYGIFLLFPRNYYPSYLVGIPFGYFLSLLIHRMFITTNEEYHRGEAMSYVAILIILGVVIFFLSDKLLFNQNHRKRATEARIIGLINVPGMTWEEIGALLKKEAKEWMKQDNQLFERAG
jgi:zinc transporter ZupT